MLGNLETSPPTGTLPLLSILSSIASCSIPSNSSSNSVSSTGSPNGAFVIAEAISSPSACCSRSSSIVASTLSIVSPPWICFMAAPAFFMAFSVSWFMFAASML